jgi:hypothetical protein
METVRYLVLERRVSGIPCFSEVDSNLNGPRLAVSIESMDGLTNNSHYVDRSLEGFHDARVAAWQAVFYVVQRGVDEDARVTPSSALHADGLMHSAAVSEFGVRDNDCVLRKKGNHGHIGVPDDVLDRRGLKLRNCGALLHVEKDDFIVAAAEEAPGACVEERCAGSVWRGAALCDLVLEVADLQRGRCDWDNNGVRDICFAVRSCTLL